MDLDALLRRAPDGVCGVGPNGTIGLWTQSAEKILGYSAREVMGRPCCEVFVEGDGRAAGLCYQVCRSPAPLTQSEPVRHAAVATRTKAGTTIWLQVSSLHVPGARPGVSMTVHLFRDITAAKQIEALVCERLVRARRVVSPDGSSPGGLTQREVEILRLIVNGANTRTIAGRLRVSPITVRNHVQNILRKLGVHSRLEAVAYVIRHRLV
jgi:PAS domain S-box-containing protein